MGVEAVAIQGHFDAKMSPVARAESPVPEVAQGGAKVTAFVLGHERNDSLIAVNRLLKAGYDVFWTQEAFSNGNKKYPPGTMIVRATGPKQAQVRSIAQALSLPLAAADEKLAVTAYKLKPLRLALYNPWGGNMDEGWTRLLLERFEFPFEEIRRDAIQSGSFSSRFDVILFADQPPEAIINGIPATRIPPEYAGGIGRDGLEHLRDFIRDGGTLVALGNSTDLFIKSWGLPLVDVVAGLKTTDFFCPGSILATQVDNTHPIGFGMPDETPAFFARSSAFEIQPGAFAPGGEVRTIVKYAGDHVLESGWILGENRLYNRAAAVEVAMQKGHLVLFGFRVQNRAQPHATFKLLFNSLYYGPSASAQVQFRSSE
jgi:hypothetical protein